MSVTQWTEELFEEMSALYVSQIEAYPEDERPGVSMEIVSAIAEDKGLSPNGFRMKLSKAGLYVKKEAGAKSGTSEKKESTGGGARTSKAVAHAELKSAFSDAGLDLEFLDADIIDKLTGKAAAHLAEAVRKITK